MLDTSKVEKEEEPWRFSRQLSAFQLQQIPIVAVQVFENCSSPWGSDKFFRVMVPPEVIGVRYVAHLSVCEIACAFGGNWVPLFGPWNLAATGSSRNVVKAKSTELLYPTIARTRTGLSAAFLFFPGATMMSEPVSGSAASRADPSTT